MIGYRWLRAATRGVVGLLTVLPALALVVAVLVDLGPDGEPAFLALPDRPAGVRPVRLDLRAE